MTTKTQEIKNNQNETANNCGIGDAARSNDRSKRSQKYQTYNFPSMDLLNEPMAVADTDADYRAKIAQSIVSKMAVFGIRIQLADMIVGPTVTRFEFDVLSPHTRMSEFAIFADDIKACAETHENVRIEAPVQGTRRVGIEVANRVRRPVLLREILTSENFRKNTGKLVFAIGRDIDGKAITADLADMPHILITGAAGTGKSMALNSLIVSLMYKYGPEYVRFIMADPKFVELSRYNGMPHMLTKETITSNSDAFAAMDCLIDEMESRYMLFRQKGLSDICEYNDSLGSDAKRLPYLVFIVDELSDLMSANKKAFESKLVRLASKSRAAGIHIVLATQRFDDKTISGVIKANMPYRLTFKVSSPYDSMIAMNCRGAEKLLDKGDMLFATPGLINLLRVQGAYLSNEDIRNVVKYLCENNEAHYDSDINDKIFVSHKQMREGHVLSKERYEQYIRFDLKADGKGYRVSSHSRRTPSEVVIPTRYHSLLVTKIGESGFADCKELVSVTIPKSVAIIGDEAFANCGNLTAVNIEVGVAEIRESAFFGCGNLKEVYYGGTQEQWQKIQIGSGNENLTAATIRFKR